MISELIRSFCAAKEEKEKKELCKTDEKSVRLQWLESTCKNLGIQYDLDDFTNNNCKFTNMYLKGSSNMFFSAHYDIFDINSDNANDNSASVINLLVLKKLAPNINVLLFDGEEPPFFGAGSSHFTFNMYKKPKFILNLELTGYGDEILISNYSNGYLFNTFIEQYDAVEYKFPFNDATIIKKIKPNIEIETIVLRPKELDPVHFHNIHSKKDSINTINTSHMENLVNQVLLPLTKETGFMTYRKFMMN